jgi:hypothetical protein
VKKYADDGQIAKLLARSLVAKLEKAREHLQHGRVRAAVNRLDAFVDQIEEQRGNKKKISRAAAKDLIRRAKALIRQLGGDDDDDDNDDDEHEDGKEDS